MKYLLLSLALITLPFTSYAAELPQAGGRGSISLAEPRRPTKNVNVKILTIQGTTALVAWQEEGILRLEKISWQEIHPPLVSNYKNGKFGDYFSPAFCGIVAQPQAQDLRVIEPADPLVAEEASIARIHANYRIDGTYDNLIVKLRQQWHEASRLAPSPRRDELLGLYGGWANEVVNLKKYALPEISGRRYMAAQIRRLSNALALITANLAYARAKIINLEAESALLEKVLLDLGNEEQQ